jgi:hypothetical protein
MRTSLITAGYSIYNMQPLLNPLAHTHRALRCVQYLDLRCDVIKRHIVSVQEICNKTSNYYNPSHIKSS